MEVEIVEIKEEEKEVLLNLIEKYLYEFSQWEKTDVNVEGNYGYEYLDCYFEEENRYPYFIKVDGKLAGFAMISDYPEVPEETTDYCLSELFVMHKYRRGGVGRKAVNSVLVKHHGKWQLKRHPHNTVSVKFWYYLICNTDGKDNLSHYRIDRMRQVAMHPVEHGKCMNQLDGIDPSFEILRYMEEHPRMSYEKPVSATLMVEEYLVEAVETEFRTTSKIKTQEHLFRIRIISTKTAICNWIINLSEHIKIETTSDPSIISIESWMKAISAGGGVYGCIAGKTGWEKSTS